MKKRLNLLLLLVFIVVCYVGYHFFQYQILNQAANIETELNTWLNKNSGEMDAEVLCMTKLDKTNSSIVLFQTERDNIGYALLKNGWNGRVKIVQSGHGNNIASYQVIDTNKGDYGIVVGKNPDLKVENIRADLLHEDFEFTINVSGQRTFLMYEKLPEEIEQPFPTDLIYFDEKGSIIELKELEI
ncbi:MAG: hypothetical protein ACQEUT_11735 [Bacillota bacterium]